MSDLQKILGEYVQQVTAMPRVSQREIDLVLAGHGVRALYDYVQRVRGCGKFLIRDCRQQLEKAAGQKLW
jgi:hypothetical protein